MRQHSQKRRVTRQEEEQATEEERMYAGGGGQEDEEEDEDEEEGEEEEERMMRGGPAASSRSSRNIKGSKSNNKGLSTATSRKGEEGYGDGVSLASGIRLKRILAGPRGGPSTPVPSWKLFDSPFQDAMVVAVASEHQELRAGACNGRISVSARKLAATLWEIQEASLLKAASEDKIRDNATQHQKQLRQQEKKQQHQPRQQQQQPQRQQQLIQRNSSGKRNVSISQWASNVSPASSHVSQRSLKRSSIQYKLGDSGKRHPHNGGQGVGAHSQVFKLLERHAGAGSMQLTDAVNGNAREVDANDRAITPTNSFLGMKVIPGDPGYGPTTSSELIKVLNRIWSLEEQHTSSMSMVAALRVELDHARAQVQELMLEKKLHNKEVETLSKRLLDEKAIWRHQEQETVRSAIQSIKEELEDERKSKRRLELLHRKVTRDLNEVKGTLDKALREHERERKARELMEDVCDELAREIGEDKAEVEELKRVSAKVREEAEEERKMLQMAEVWREERVQMKLAEARLELEEKNTALDKLRSELEAFLKAKRAGDARDEGRSSMDVKKLEMRKGLADSSHLNDARVTGQESSDSVLPNEHGAVGRSSVDSVHLKEARDGSCTVQEQDDEGSIDDDLHSIELHLGGNTSSSQWGYHSVAQQEIESKGRSTARTTLAIEQQDKGKNFRGGKAHVLEGRNSSQLDDELAAVDSRGIGQWDYMRESQWIDRNIGKEDVKEWNRKKRFSLDSNERVDSPWQSDHEESQDHIIFNIRGTGRNLHGGSDSLSRSGGALSESTGSKHETDVKFEPHESNSTWRLKGMGTMRDPQSNSGLTSLQQSHVASSPTRQWGQYWSSPDPGSPLRRSSKGSTDLATGVRDNSLKAKLLEARIEGQQARLRGGKRL